MKNRKSVFFVLSICFAFFCVIILYSLFLSKSSCESISEEEEEKFSHVVNKYEVLIHDLETNENTIESTELPSPIPKNEYISYEKYNKLFLVSKFGSEKFLCTGFCSCSSNNNEGRSTTTLVKKGVKTLVAAVSTLLAVDLARKNFKESCQNKISCSPSSSVISEVESCEEQEQQNQQINDEEKKEEQQKTVEIKEEVTTPPEIMRPKEKEKTPYKCRGKCVANYELQYSVSVKKSVNYGCEDREYTGVIRLWDNNFKTGMEQAKILFFWNVLVEKCVKYSREKLLLEKISSTGVRREKWIFPAMCSAPRKSDVNLFVFCRRVPISYLPRRKAPDPETE